MYDKRDDFNFKIAYLPLIDGDVPQSPFYGIYISQRIHFVRMLVTSTIKKTIFDC